MTLAYSNTINSSFISTVDHLPADIIRSLWVLQSINIKVEKCKIELNTLLAQYKDQLPELLTSKYIQLHQRIKYLKSEAIAESKALNNQLVCHKILLHEQTSQLFQLKNKTTHNDVNRLGNKELREKLKLHYKDNPLISQVEALKERESNKSNSSQKVILKLPKLMKHNDGLKNNKSLQKTTPIKLKMTDENKNTRLSKTRPKRKVVAINPTIKQDKRASNTSRTRMKSTTLEPVKSRPVTEQSLVNDELYTGEEQAAGDEDTQKYCFCKQGSFGNMIACDNEESCPNGEWFHYKCVGLQNVVEALKFTVGKEKWFCSEFCRARYKESQEQAPKPAKKKKKRRW